MYGAFSYASAKEGQPQAEPQKPPAMRVGIKLKQKDFLSDIMEVFKPPNINREEVLYGE